MRVLVTGGTGFVGSHAVAALVGAGHRPRLLVRSAGRVGTALDPLGVQLDMDADVVVGDATDEASVREALEGCEAAVHAASVVSLHVRDADHVLDVNRRAAELVVGGAIAAGLDPVVHVSSLSAIVPQPDGTTVTGDVAIPDPSTQGPYGRSKAAAEQVARDLQASGAPVVTVYPAMVMGPHDPHLGEGTTAWRNVLRGLLPVMPPGGFHIVDVRDLGALIAAMTEPGRGPRRYLTTGHHVSASHAVAELSRITGRWLPNVQIPAGLVHVGGRLADWVQQVLPVRLPLGYEAITTLTSDPDCDDGDTWSDLGVAPRPLEDTTRDLIRWLVAEDLLSPAQAGRALPDSAS